MTRTRFVIALVSFLAGSAIADAQTVPSNSDICRADVNKSGVVDTPDVDAVTAAYRTRRGDAKFNPAVDFDGDGAITLSDRTFVTTKVGLRCVTSELPLAPT